MSDTISSVIVPAIGILVSPIPLVGLILIMFSDRARINSIAFLIGWIFGNLGVFLIAMFFIGDNITDVGDPSKVKSLIDILLGIILVGFGIFEFTKRPKKNEKVNPPKWLDKVDKFHIPEAFGLAVLMSAANPEDMLFALTAGVSVGYHATSITQAITGAIVFILIACSTVYIPTLIYLVAGSRLHGLLEKARVFLIKYNSIIMAILFVGIGIMVISKAF